ncbi:hypothetical protein GJ744_010712 [Endocarpon pusillum]|uniref:Uncharacterized protein n=1 Tax=Endocarpon pusillum TaxID=364733 RepID=A0A8H7AE65_9EURO|nr:hypothetical protein GJ744_010712 [Endocarpon pusillum]
MPGSWPSPRLASGYGSDESGDKQDDGEEMPYLEPDLVFIGELLEDIERSPPALEARLLLMQSYAGCGWHKAAKEEAHQVLAIDGSIEAAQIYLGDRCKASLRRDNGGENRKATAKPASTGTKSKVTGKDATELRHQRAQPPTWRPRLVEITSEAVSLQELEDGYVALMKNAQLLLGEMKLLEDLNVPHCEEQILDLAAMAEGQVSSVVRARRLQSLKTVAEAIVADSTDGFQNGLNTAVKDLDDVARWLREPKDTAEASGKDKSRSTSNDDQDEIREALVKRAKALKVFLPQPLQPLVDLAMMHAEHEFLNRKYVNDETMYLNPVSGIPRANFWTSEDGYAWDMEELVRAIRSGGGVMRNPLSKQMFTRVDVRAIVQHHLGNGLQALQLEQSKLKHGVRPQTINELDTLAKVFISDMTENGKPSRVAVEAWVSYLETLPSHEQEAIDKLKVPAKDSYTGMPFDRTIGEAVEDMQGNRVCLHKTGDFLAQAVRYLR